MRRMHLLLIPALCAVLEPAAWARLEPSKIGNPEAAAPSKGPLADHEALAGVVGVSTSDHFAFKWGGSATPVQAQVAEALATLEDAYRIQVEEFGFALPNGMTTWRMNVYLGDSGIINDGQDLTFTTLPSDVVGFNLLDSTGVPFIAVARDAWSREAEWVAQGRLRPGQLMTIIFAHEFHHTSQQRTNPYPRGFRELWWFEAMAMWAAEQQATGAVLVWEDAAKVHAMPELAIDDCDPDLWFSTGDLTEEQMFLLYRENGVFVLPLLLSTDLDRQDLLVRWATDDGGESKPLDRLAGLLAEEGNDMGTVMVPLWAELQAGILASSETLPQVLATTQFPANIDHNPTASLVPGTGWQAPPEALRPQRYGANMLRVDAPQADLVVNLASPGAGSARTPVRFGLAAVVCADQLPCQLTILSDGGGTLSNLPVAAKGANYVDLVVVALADRKITAETFDYRVRVDAVAEAAMPEETGGCGCTSTSGTWSLPMVLLPTLLRPRRRTM